MRAAGWEGALCTVIGQYKASSPGAAFRNDYGAVLSRAAAEKTITPEDVELLRQARSYLEGWVSDTPPDGKTAFEQWQTLYKPGKDRLSTSLLECILRRFPKPKTGAVDWEPFLIACSEPSLIKALLDQRLIKGEDLNRVAKTQPNQFYRSQMLDVALGNSSFKCPVPLWNHCIEAAPRPGNLLSKEEVIVRCYAADRGEESNKRMVAFLLESPDARQEVLTALLKDQGAALRLCRKLTLDQPAGGRRTKRDGANSTDAVLRDWVVACEGALEKGGEIARTAALVLALIRLSGFASKNGSSKAKVETTAELAARTSERAIVRALRSAEGGGANSVTGVAFVLRGDELYRAVQEYLRDLPVSTPSGQEPPERALRYERYMGSKAVVNEVLSALEDVPGNSELHDAIEVALFNAGVRQLGEAGEQVRFDVHAHRAETAGMLPDDPVVISQPGRCLGDDAERVVLVKASVRPVPGTR